MTWWQLLGAVIFALVLWQLVSAVNELYRMVETQRRVLFKLLDRVGENEKRMEKVREGLRILRTTIQEALDRGSA